MRTTRTRLTTTISLAILTLIVLAMFVFAVPSLTLNSPTNTTYPNSTIDVSYDTNATDCNLELDGTNITYLSCSNTTLTYVHYIDANKFLSFDFATGTGSTAYDRSGGADNGTISGGTFVQGKYGYALNLSSGSDTIVPVSPGGGEWHGVDSAMSFAFWMYPQKLNAEQTIIDEGGSTNGIYLGIETTGRISFNTQDNQDIDTIEYPLSLSQWQFIVVTFDNNNLSLYIDGVLVNTTTAAYSSISAHNDEPGIGYTVGTAGDDGGPNRHLNATLDEMAFYNDALSADEVLAMYGGYAFNGSHNLTIWANDGSLSNESVSFSIAEVDGASITLIYPENTTYTNSTINITYNVSDQSECKIELNSVNMSYPLCSNTTLTYVHMNDSSKIVAYDFAEGTGTTVHDRSSGQNHSTFVNDPFWNSSGRVGYALTFDGGDDYIENTGFSWNSTGGPVTVMYWSYVRSADWQTSSLFSVGDSATSTNRFHAHSPWSDGNLYWDYGDVGGTGRISTSYAAYDDKWTHVALVSEGNGGSFKAIYLDGQHITNESNSSGPSINLSTLSIGRGMASAWYNHNGSIDEFVIYNRTLSGEEILAHYNANAFDGTHQMTVWVNDSLGEWYFDSVGFTIGKSVTIDSPENTIYTNTTIDINYSNNFGANQCKIQLNSVNMSYPLCSNTTLTYVHFNDSSKVAAFDFAEGMGGASYDRVSGKENITGTLSGGVNWTTSGKYGNAITFNGTDGYFTINDSTLYDFSTGAFTISFWFNKTDEDRGDILSWKNGGWDELGIIAQADETIDIYLLINAAGGFVVTNGGTFTLNEWHQFTVTRNASGNITTYIDGEIDGTGTSTRDINEIDSGTPIVLGANGANSFHVEGQLDEFAMWNRSLSQTEIQNIYNEQSASGTQQLTVWANDSSDRWYSDSVIFNILDAGDCGTTITTNFNVSSDGTISGNCLTVSASNIVIDGQGYNIIGDGTGIGVSNLGRYENVTIKNMIISGFGEGIHANLSTEFNLSNVTAVSNTVDLVLNNTNLTYATNNIASYELRNSIKINTTQTQLEWLVDLNANGTNFSNDIVLAFNKVAVNGSNPGLNLSANITLVGLPTNYGFPGMLRNGVSCSTCTNHTGLNDGVVVFSTTGFSNLSVNESCGTVTESFTLVQDVTTDGDCYTVNADNIVIDGGGHTITGDSGSGDYGIVDGTTTTNLTVKNIKIGFFDTSIYFTDINLTVENSIIYNNSNDGIFLNNEGFYINNNTISNNSDEGIYLSSTTGGTISNSTFEGNIDYSFWGQSSSGATVIRNTFDGNPQIPLIIESGSDMNIMYNTITNNVGTSAIWTRFSGSSYNISHNTINHTSGTQAIYFDSVDSHIYNNTIFGDQNGITIAAARNKISQNNITDTTARGISLFSTGSNTHITNNHIHDNPDGIYCNAAANGIYEYNNIESSTDNGIEFINTCTNVTIRYNTITDSATAVDLTPGPQLTFHNNTLITVSNDGIEVGSDQIIANNSVKNAADDCIFATVDVNNVTLIDNTIFNCTGDGMDFRESHNITVSGGTITNATNGIYVRATNDASTNHLFEDVTMSNITTYFISVPNTGAGATDNITALNISYDASQENVGAGEQLFRSWWYQASVTSGGSPLSGVAVNIYNNTGGLEESLTTDGSGLISKVALKHYFNDAGTRANHTPHTINLTRSRYNDASYSRNMTSNIVVDSLMMTARSVTLSSPLNTTYTNSTINVTYVRNYNEQECKIELNRVNMSYPLCSNTTLTYVHFNDSTKVLGLDFSAGTGTTAYDRAGTSDDAIMSGDPTWNTSSKYGTGLQYDGDDYLSISSPSFSTITNKNFTIMMWYMNQKTATGDVSIFSQQNGGGTGRSWLAHNTTSSCSGRLYSYLGGSAVCTSQIMEQNTWYHISLTSNTTHIGLYVNGQQENLTAQNADENADGNIIIGAANTPAQYITGLIDEITIWNRTLNENEISAMYTEEQFAGAHELTVWANDSDGELYSDTVYFSINNPADPAGAVIISPQNINYDNSNISITYDAINQNQCKIQLNNVNMSYPLCSNTTLTYVHMNDSRKMFAVDFAGGTGTTVYDRSPNEFTGTFGNNAYYTTESKHNFAISFDGTNDHVSFGDVVDFNTHNFTTCLWMNTTDTGSSVLIGKKGVSSTGWLFFKLNEQLRLRLNDSTETDFTSEASLGIQDGQWHHICLVANRTENAYFYVDGIQKGSADISSRSGSLSGSDVLCIGGNSCSGGTAINTYTGNIDEVAIWNRTFSAKEIEYLYHDAGFPGQHTLKVWTNNSADSWVVNQTTFTINGFSCNPKTGLDWTLDLADNCTVLNKNIDLDAWQIYSSGDGTITIQNTNITYNNRTMGNFIGDSRMILAQETIVRRG